MPETHSPTLQSVWVDIDRRKAELATAWPADWPTPAKVWAFDATADFMVLIEEADAARAIATMPFQQLVAVPCLNGQRVKLKSRLQPFEQRTARLAGTLAALRGANYAGVFLGDYAQGYVQLADWTVCVQIPGHSDLVTDPSAQIVAMG